MYSFVFRFFDFLIFLKKKKILFFSTILLLDNPSNPMNCKNDYSCVGNTATLNIVTNAPADNAFRPPMTGFEFLSNLDFTPTLDDLDTTKIPQLKPADLGSVIDKIPLRNVRRRFWRPQVGENFISDSQRSKTTQEGFPLSTSYINGGDRQTYHASVNGQLADAWNRLA